MLTGTLCPGRRRPTAPTATVCIYSMYSVTEGEDVNGTAKFCVPWAVSLEQFASGQQFVSESVQKGGFTHFTSVVDNNEHHPVLLGRFVIVAPSRRRVQTYLELLTVALTDRYHERRDADPADDPVVIRLVSNHHCNVIAELSKS